MGLIGTRIGDCAGLVEGVALGWEISVSRCVGKQVGQCQWQKLPARGFFSEDDLRRQLDGAGIAVRFVRFHEGTCLLIPVRSSDKSAGMCIRIFRLMEEKFPYGPGYRRISWKWRFK